MASSKAANKPVISATGVTKRYGLFDVLKDASFSIQAGEKVGLVGANGAGKSTLLKILTGEIQPDSGTVTRAKGLSVGYVPQHFGDALVMTAEQFLASASGRTDGAFKADILTWFKRLSLAESVLARPLRELSGGEKTKLALARIVLSTYDLFLLDEPTNNLDFEALGYLERFVKESGKAFVIVSHDRRFLDETVSKVIEVSETDRVVRMYDGGFTDYMEERKARIEREWEAYEESKDARDKLAKAIKTQEKDAYTVRISKKAPDTDKFTSNFKRENAQIQFQKAANAMKTRLSRMDDIEKPKNELPLRVRFEIDTRSGGKVFELAGVTKALPEVTLGPIDLLVSYGDRILITGENGSGKSTLVKILTEAIKPDSGTVVRGTGVHLGYLPQEEDFRADEGVMEAFARHFEYPESEARKILNRFRITAEDVKKKIGELSSGERSRLIIATIMARKANCLVLDEPSNHLDFEAMEEFEDALREFKGTLIVVSHDRYFIEKIGFGKAYKVSGGRLSSVN